MPLPLPKRHTVLGGGIPVSIHLATPVLIGQSIATGENGPIVNGTANATV